jgi:hypothetical protein
MARTKANAIEQPNLFILAGRDISATVALSGVDGNPKFAYQDTQRVLAFSGDEITMENTALGTLATVTIARTVDLGSTTFTVLLPEVNLIGNHHQIRTIGITSLHRTTIAGIGRGQLTDYTTIRLHGTAEQVDF